MKRIVITFATLTCLILAGSAGSQEKARVEKDLLGEKEIPAGAVLHVKDGQEVKEKAVVCRWDPHHVPIIAEVDGQVKYDEIVEGKTMKEEHDAVSGVTRRQIVEHKGDLHPLSLIHI